jgi:hypothetical protein
MLRNFIKGQLRRARAVASISAIVLAVAATAAAQDAVQTPTPPAGTQPQHAATAAPAEEAGKTMREGTTPTGVSVAAKAVVEPLYREYKGIKIGMSATDVSGRESTIKTARRAPSSPHTWAMTAARPHPSPSSALTLKPSPTARSTR